MIFIAVILRKRPEHAASCRLGGGHLLARVMNSALKMQEDLGIRSQSRCKTTKTRWQMMMNDDELRWIVVNDDEWRMTNDETCLGFFFNKRGQINRCASFVHCMGQWWWISPHRWAWVQRCPLRFGNACGPYHNILKWAALETPWYLHVLERIHVSSRHETIWVYILSRVS